MDNSENAARSELQRVVFPRREDPAVLPLYVDVGDEGPPSAVTGRRELRVPAGARASLATYFNAFPASYWQRWSTLSAVVLRVATTGEGRLLVHRSNAAGSAEAVLEVELIGQTSREFRLPLEDFADGGWYWFDLEAGGGELVLSSAEWCAPGEVPLASGTVSLAITTLNRGDYCTEVLTELAADGAALEVIDRVYVVDQGTDRLAAHPRFAEAREGLGAKLTVVEQANLGGSGGFSRGMLETAWAGESDYVLLLDDDVQVEPESIRRLVRFSDHLRAPAIVGGHMFDLHQPSRLHAFAERIDLRPFMWGPAGGGHDFAEAGLRETPRLHERADTAYNGWWMCLIPVPVLREIGLSLPVFIKWDDAEYGLRAAEHGIPTVTLPGAGVWHVSWVNKGDALDWQAFYHARNRLLTALLHSPHRRGGTLLLHNVAVDVKHLLTMEYSTAAARFEAYRSVLAGPGGLRAELPTRLGSLKRLARRFSDGAPVDPSALPAVPPSDAQIRSAARSGPGRMVIAARDAVRHLVSPARSEDATPPQAHLSTREARWWVVPSYDSVLVTNAEKTAVFWRRRDRALFRAGIRQSLGAYRRLRRQWAALATEYRESLAEITSIGAWRAIFAAAEDERDTPTTAPRS